jgi:vanillate O-demethylase ferredoxin subunit
MSMTTIPVVVDALMAQGRGSLAVRLVAQDEQALPAFEAGAHIDLHLGRGLIRQYSIASPPHERAHYLLCVKKESASRGGSAHVHERLRVGDALQISLPRNLFALQPAEHQVLLAGGIGITPLLSMAEALDQSMTSFELHYYVQSRRDAAFAKRLASGFAHGRVHLHCSVDGDSCRKGLPAGVQVPAKGTRLYLCGPEGFMQHVVDAALAAGWDQDKIHREAFAAPSAVAPVAGAAAFQVELASSRRVFDIPADRSIASILVDAGVNVPLSCEMGICGACLTPVIDGVVDHRDSVQSDAERAAPLQQIALCCSRSHSAMITIDL